MRLTTFLLIIVIATYFIQGFNQPKCEHVFTHVEQPVIKISEPVFTLGGGVYHEYSWPSGMQEGKDIICVKCFHVQKQKIDYGPEQRRSLVWPDTSPLNICWDTTRSMTAGSVGGLFLKVDTLQWSKVKPVK